MPTRSFICTPVRAACAGVLLGASVLLASPPIAGAAPALSDAAGLPDPALAHCERARVVEQSPPVLREATTADERRSPVCAAGALPHPTGRVGHKGRPGKAAPATNGTTTSGTSYLYDYAYQYTTAIGTAARLSQAKPFLSTADFHSLGEIAAQSTDGRQIVEVGWTVDRGVNNGDTNPHLFVFHWVNGAPSCYNGCGWVQYSATRYPGMPVSVTATPQDFAIEYYGGNWWVWYQTEWIGYFPGSLWTNAGINYSSVGLSQWFGEVAASSPSPCTDMGDGVYGSLTGSAAITNIRLLSTPTTAVAANPGHGMTQPAYYNIGAQLSTSYRFGGPGAC
jgi:hypothetical protein